MHAPELEDDALHTSADESAPELVTDSLAKNRSHVTDGNVGGSSVVPRIAVSLEQNDLVDAIGGIRKRSGAWPTVNVIVTSTGYSKTRVRRMLRSLERVGVVEMADDGTAIVLAKPAGILHWTIMAARLEGAT